PGRYHPMGPIRLGVGTEWLLDGRAFRIVRQLGPDRFAALDLKFNTERTIGSDEILAEYAKGRLSFATPELAATEETSAPRPTAFPDLPPATRGIIELRWQSIEPFTKLGRRPTAEEFQARADELA